MQHTRFDEQVYRADLDINSSDTAALIEDRAVGKMTHGSLACDILPLQC